MGVVWASPSSSQRRLAHAPVRERQLTDSFRSGSALPREVLGSSAAFASRGTFSRWLRVFRSLGARSQRMPFRGLLDEPMTLQPSKPRMSFASLSLSDGADRDAFTVARRSRALDALARTNRAVRADLHNAGRSRPPGELRDP